MNFKIFYLQILFYLNYNNVIMIQYWHEYIQFYYSYSLYLHYIILNILNLYSNHLIILYYFDMVHQFLKLIYQ